MTVAVHADPSRPERSGSNSSFPFVSPAFFDFWVGRLNPAWSWSRALARIVGLKPESSDAVTLLLRPNRHWRGCAPGQHVNVGADIDGRRITRSYSLSDAARPDGLIAITVKAVEGGLLSSHLCRKACIGDVLHLGIAFGEMVLAEADNRLLLLAGGSGITPMMAIIRAEAAAGMRKSLNLMYWAGARDEFCFVDELRELAVRHANFQVRFVLTREEPVSGDECEGRMALEQIQKQVPDLPQRTVYACGPDGFVEGARSMLVDRVARFRAEAFTPPACENDEQGVVQVTLLTSGVTLAVARGRSLLSALEDAGLTPASGCRMGICNTCACTKRSGTSRHVLTGEEQSEPLSTLRLCVNSAVGDLILEL